MSKSMMKRIAIQAGVPVAVVAEIERLELENQRLWTENARLTNRLARVRDALHGKPWTDDDTTALPEPRLADEGDES